MAENYLTWDEVVEKPDYQKLSALRKQEAANEYFKNVVQPKVPNKDYQIASDEFFEYVNELERPQGPPPTPDVSVQAADERSLTPKLAAELEAPPELPPTVAAPPEVVGVATVPEGPAPEKWEPYKDGYERNVATGVLRKSEEIDAGLGPAIDATLAPFTDDIDMEFWKFAQRTAPALRTGINNVQKAMYTTGAIMPVSKEGRKKADISNVVGDIARYAGTKGLDQPKFENDLMEEVYKAWEETGDASQVIAEAISALGIEGSAGTMPGQSREEMQAGALGDRIRSRFQSGVEARFFEKPQPTEPLIKALRKRRKEIAGQMDEYYKNHPEYQLPEDYYQLKESERRKKYPEYYWGDAVFSNAIHSITGMGAFIGGTAASGGNPAVGALAAGIGMYPSFVGELYDEIEGMEQEEGIIVPEDVKAQFALVGAIPIGMTEGLSEWAAGIGKMFKPMRKKVTKEVLKKTVMNQIRKNIATRAAVQTAKMVAGGAAEEGIQKFGANVTKQMLGSEKPLTEGVAEASIVGGGVAPFIGGGPAIVQSAVMGARQKAADRDATIQEADEIRAMEEALVNDLKEGTETPESVQEMRADLPDGSPEAVAVDNVIAKLAEPTETVQPTPEAEGVVQTPVSETGSVVSEVAPQDEALTAPEDQKQAEGERGVPLEPVRTPEEYEAMEKAETEKTDAARLEEIRTKPLEEMTQEEKDFELTQTRKQEELRTKPIVPPGAEMSEEQQAEWTKRVEEINKKNLKEMTEAEKDVALTYSQLTGLKNKRGYNDSKRKDIQVSIDGDSLKYVNDTFGHDAGNGLLRRIGASLRKSGVKEDDRYHFSGDEFGLQANSEKEVDIAIKKANNYLKANPLRIEMADGTTAVVPVRFTHVTGKKGEKFKDVDKRLKPEKEKATVEGRRARRGDEPPGIYFEDKTGRVVDRRQKVSDQKVAETPEEKLARLKKQVGDLKTVEGEKVKDAVARKMREGKKKPPTSIRLKEKPTKAPEFKEEKVKHMSVEKALKKGLIDKDTAILMDSVADVFPESMKGDLKKYFKPRVSEQEFKATKEQVKAVGLPAKDKARATVRAFLKPEKIGKAKKDARHLAVLLKGGKPVDFIHEFAEFTHERLLSGPDVTTVKAEYAKAKEAKKEQTKKLRAEGKKVPSVPFPERNEWFADQFTTWFVRQNLVPKGLRGIFRKMAKALKKIYSRAPEVSPGLIPMFEDIVTNGREVKLKDNLYWSEEEMLRNYITGRPPTDDEIKAQGVHWNQKTGFSVDFSTSCPKQLEFVNWLNNEIQQGNIVERDLLDHETFSGLYDEALRNGVDVPCSYCYVEEARRKAIFWHSQGGKKTKALFAQAKQVVTEPVVYKDRLIAKDKNGEYILPDKEVSPKAPSVEGINKRGGLRLYSFSDYIRERDFASMKRLLAHASERGIGVKAITKQETFVDDWADTGININVSVDHNQQGGPGAGMAWDTAIKYKEKYKKKNLRIRTVGRNMNEIDRYYRMMYKIDKKGNVKYLDAWTVKGKDKFPDKKNPNYDAELKKGEWKRVFGVITPYHKDSPKEVVRPGYEDMGYKDKGIVKFLDEHEDSKQRFCCLEKGKCWNEITGPCSANCGLTKGHLAIPEKVGHLAGKGPQYQVQAFHGGPHALKKFSTDYMGTGEGYQAFGWGLYFTDQKDIAKYYADHLGVPKVKIDGKTITNSGGLADREITATSIKVIDKYKLLDSNLKFKIAETITWDMQESSKRIPAEDYAEYWGVTGKTLDEATQAVKDLYKAIEIGRGRNIYEVSLHKGKKPSEYDFMRWDKPVTTKQVKKINSQLETIDLENLDYDPFESLAIAGIRGEHPRTKNYIPSGDEIVNDLSYLLGSPKKASMFLLDAGIDGNKFRSDAGQGKGYNYVVFDDKAITVEEHEQYQKKADLFGKSITAKDARAMFPNQDSGVNPDGTVWIKTKGGDRVNIQWVDNIKADEMAVRVGYAQPLGQGEMIAGAYQDSTIYLQKDIADKWTIPHETLHWMEDPKVGIVNARDQRVLKNKIKKLVAQGKIDTVNAKDIGGSEDRATYISDQLKNRTEKGTIGKIIQKIADFIDGLVNLAGKKTARSMVRGFETGKIFEGKIDKKTRAQLEKIDNRIQALKILRDCAL